jgi:hypothetical protein
VFVRSRTVFFSLPAARGVLLLTTGALLGWLGGCTPGPQAPEDHRKGPLQAAWPEPGPAAPDFYLPDSSGKRVSLRQLRGGYVLLAFRSPAQQPDSADAANLRRLHQQFASRGLSVVHLWLGLARPGAAALPGQHLRATGAAEARLARRYGLTARYPLPHCVLVGPQGQVLARGLQGRALGQKIAEYIPLD